MLISLNQHPTHSHYRLGLAECLSLMDTRGKSYPYHPTISSAVRWVGKGWYYSTWVLLKSSVSCGLKKKLDPLLGRLNKWGGAGSVGKGRIGEWLVFVWIPKRLIWHEPGHKYKGVKVCVGCRGKCHPAFSLPTFPHPNKNQWSFPYYKLFIYLFICIIYPNIHTSWLWRGREGMRPLSFSDSLLPLARTRVLKFIFYIFFKLRYFYT